MIEELVHVSAGLRADGGGAAHFGRLCGRAMRGFCARRGLRFRGFHLPSSDFASALDGYRCCDGSKARLVREVAVVQARRRCALVFDHPGPARLQGLLPAPLRRPFAVALLGIDAWRPFDAAGRRALASARVVMVISRATAARAAPFLPAGCDPRIVHPGIEPPDLAGAPDAAVVERAGEGFVLVAGRLDERERYKGHDELLAALAELVRRGVVARLVVVGDGGDRQRLESRAQELGLGGRVLFTGTVSGATLATLSRRAALFAMPSRGEGFGLAFVEAMAAGLPCVALTDTAPAEIIVDGETGRLVPEGDSEALASALSELLTDPERACALGAAGHRRYEADFTVEAFARRLEPALEELVAD